MGITRSKFGHAGKCSNDLQLAGGFAGEIEHPVEVSGSKLPQGEFQEHAGFAKSGWRFEKDERVPLEESSELRLRRFLTRARCGECRTKPQAAQTFARA